MGFKKIKLVDLETSMSPAFMGMPLKEKEEKSYAKEDLEWTEVKGIAKSSEILIQNEEILDFFYNKYGKFNYFNGRGSLHIVNGSKKDRVWDVKLKLENTKNLIIESDQVVYNILEPEEDKVLYYDLERDEKYEIPLIINEEINNLIIPVKDSTYLKENLENLENLLTDEEKKAHLEELQRQKKLKAQEIKITNEKLNECELSLKSLEKNYEHIEFQINNVKSSLEEEFNQRIINENKLEILENFAPLEKDYKSNLEKLRQQIQKLNSEYTAKEEEIKTSISNEYEPQLEANQKDFEQNEKKLNEATKKITEMKLKEKELSTRKKNLNKQLKKLNKLKTKEIKKGLSIEKAQEIIGTKIDKAQEELSSISPELVKLQKGITEWTNTEAILISRVKKLKTTIEEIEDNKEKTLNEQLNHLSQQKREKINEFESQIQTEESKLKKLNSKFSEVNNIKKEIQEKHSIKLQALTQERELILTDIREIEEKRDVLKKKLKELDPEAYVKEKKDDRTKDLKEDLREFTSGFRKRKVLILGKDNKLNFKITVKNISNDIIKNISLAKKLEKGFYNAIVEKSRFYQSIIDNNTIIFEIKELKPKEEITLNLKASLFLQRRELFGTGIIEVSFVYNKAFSGLKIKDFSAYAQLRHAIKKKEREKDPNIWDCSLMIYNNSNFNIDLKSIKVLNEDQSISYINLKSDLSDEKKITIKPRDQYNTEKWTIKSLKEPKFLRSLKYSTASKFITISRMNLRIEQNNFEIIDFRIEKKFSIRKIKSFEESKIQANIIVKNTGTIPIDALIIKDFIPKDFIPDLKLENYKIRTSLGQWNKNNLKISFLPDNADATTNHYILFKVFSDENKQILDVDEFIEVLFDFKAITPDYRKKYIFNIETEMFYSCLDKVGASEFYLIKHSMDEANLPKLNIIHKRRDILISKEIYPGRTSDEFGISLLIKNDSNIDLSDISLNDSISKIFKIVSSNINYELNEDKKNNVQIIEFSIPQIRSYQEVEIKYYVKSIEGSNIGFEELESFMFS
ncbi:MAG: hypothetical protein ACTSR8_15685 [Promethearchaeota archaeon]